MIKIDYTQAKILVVDDNPANIDILLEVLSSFDVRAALDGESALEAVSEELPDLILLDIAMPGLDGFDVLQRIKDDPSTASIPVLILSNLGQKDEIETPYLREDIAEIKIYMKERFDKISEQIAELE